VSAGTCSVDSCKFDHNSRKVAICKDFLFNKDGCSKGADVCDLSHVPSYKRVPICTHYAKGHCKNGGACHYAHVDVLPGPLVCRDFAVLGYCDKGKRCDQQHIFECPDFVETGNCPDNSCKLNHVKRAHRDRRARRNDESESEDSDSDDEMKDATDNIDSKNGNEEDVNFDHDSDFVNLR
jgi:hypothetical protein